MTGSARADWWLPRRWNVEPVFGSSRRQTWECVLGGVRACGIKHKLQAAAEQHAETLNAVERGR